MQEMHFSQFFYQLVKQHRLLHMTHRRRQGEIKVSTAITLQMTVECDDADRLFHAAIGRAKSIGMTVGAFNEARRRSIHEMAFDVESVLKASLAEAGCRLSVVDNVVVLSGASRPFHEFGKQAVSRKS
jgi:hypothetical protein